MQSMHLCNVFISVSLCLDLFSLSKRWILQARRVRWPSTAPCKLLVKTLETSTKFLLIDGTFSLYVHTLNIIDCVSEIISTNDLILFRVK